MKAAFTEEKQPSTPSVVHARDLFPEVSPICGFSQSFPQGFS
jgi:hypothetical protein